MSFKIGRAMRAFLGAYFVVTVVCYSMGYAAEAILQPPPPEEGASIFESPAFVATVPYQLLANFLTWTLFAGLYFRASRPPRQPMSAYILLGAVWLVWALVIDFFGFVYIESPFSLTPRQFYIEYQPWISITYLIVFASPACYGLISRLRLQARNAV